MIWASPLAGLWLLLIGDISGPSRWNRTACTSGFQKARASPGLSLSSRMNGRSIVHSAHSAHAAAARHGWALLLRQFGDHRFGSDQEARNRGSILQRDAHNLGRVDDAL